MHKIILLLMAVTLISGCATTKRASFIPKDGEAYHKVRPKETLVSIAKKYHVTLGDLAKANDIFNVNRIESGQMLVIPKKEISPAVSRAYYKSAQTVTQAAAGKIYYSRSNESFLWPVKGRVISKFGEVKGASLNKGIDIESPYGSSVFASKAGKVVFCSEDFEGYGKTIIIDHGDGYQTVYSYNSENLVKENDIVSQKQVIAKVGKGGRAKSPSLHFELRKGHRAENPLYYLS